MAEVSNDTPTGEVARRELFATLYAELRRIAARELRRKATSALSPTTLLHETFLRVSPAAASAWQDEAHFMAYATRTMRGLIVDFMRNRGAHKRGGHNEIVSLTADGPCLVTQDLEIDRLCEALDALASTKPRLAQCVELKFFCGFSFGEIAHMWQVSERTVQREWDKARLLLQQLIDEHSVVSRATLLMSQPTLG